LRNIILTSSTFSNQKCFGRKTYEVVTYDFFFSTPITIVLYAFFFSKKSQIVAQPVCVCVCMRMCVWRVWHYVTDVLDERKVKSNTRVRGKTIMFILAEHIILHIIILIYGNCISDFYVVVLSLMSHKN